MSHLALGRSRTSFNVRALHAEFRRSPCANPRPCLDQRRPPPIFALSRRPRPRAHPLAVRRGSQAGEPPSSRDLSTQLERLLEESACFACHTLILPSHVGLEV